VVSIIGSPHRVTLAGIKEAALNNQARWSHLPRPHIAVLIGGRSKSHDLDATTAETLSQSLIQTANRLGGSLFVTMSRRTPPLARKILVEQLNTVPAEVYDLRGENPYMAFLGTADMILVSEDSVNMITEACATGKPVFRLKLKPKLLRWPQKKFNHLYESLEKKGIIRLF